ncbi:MAG: iron-containing alcohol dehydrogenase [Desulfobacterales bacterium]
MFYEFNLPVKLIVGGGCSDQLAERLSEHGIKRVMCIHDKGVADAGLTSPLLEGLASAGVEVIVFDEVLPDPPMEIITRGSEVAAAQKPDAFVAIGGGSSIDTAKAVNADYTNPGTLLDHALNLNGLQILPYENPLKPFFALPTTAGTGSEVSPTAVVTDTQRKLKLSIASLDQMPTAALIDPKLMAEMPPDITASTGMDAFSHAVEGLMGGLALLSPSPMRESFALKAVELVLAGLRPALENGYDMRARTDMAYAAFMSILGALGGLSFGHAVGHAIGEVCSIHKHGFLCASVLPYNIIYLAEFIPEQLKKLAALMTVNAEGKTPAETAEAVGTEVRKFYTDIGMPSLKAMGMDLSKVKEIAHHATLGQYYQLAPKKPTEEEIAGWLEQAYGQ